METTEDKRSAPLHEERATRRDVLTVGTVALGCAGACALAAPFLDSLREASFSEDALSGGDAVLEIDLSALTPGAQKVVAWRRWPVFIQHRTPAMLAALRDPALIASLRDPESRTRQQPADATNWHRSVRPEYGVLIGICTHLGCIPGRQNNGRYLCPCHGSHFDGAGRVLRGMPAAYNLPVPPVSFIGPHRLRLGHSAGDPRFSMDDIQQI